MSAAIRPFRLRRLVARGWQAFTAHAGLMLASLLTLIALWALLEILVIATQRLGVGLNVALHLAYLVVAAGLELGLVKTSLTIVDGGSAAYRDLFSELHNGPYFLAGKLLYLLLMFLGLISLVVPGIFLGSRYAMFPGLMAEGQRNPVEALKESSEMVRGRTGPLSLILLTLLLFNALGACLLGVGLLLTFPTTLLTLAHLYRQVQRDSLPAPSAI